MPKLDFVAVVASAGVAFVIGGLWYSPLLFGKTYVTLRGLDPSSVEGVAMPVGEMVAEFGRWLVIAFVLARFMALLGAGSLTEAAMLGGWVWMAIYTALAGSVIHEGYPWRLYAIHVGDGLAKIMAITTVLALWRR